MFVQVVKIFTILVTTTHFAQKKAITPSMPFILNTQRKYAWPPLCKTLHRISVISIVKPFMVGKK